MIHRLAASRYSLPGAVLLAVAVVVLIAWATQPGATHAAAAVGQSATVTSVTRSCPPAAPGAGMPRISMIAVPAAGSGTAAKGTATFSPVLAGGKAKTVSPVTVTAAETVTTVAGPDGGAASVVATGRMAQGFAAEQTDASGTGLVTCTHPGSDMWFVGTGQASGATQVSLYLMNTGNVTASVDLTILTDTGLQSGPNGAVTVAPNQFVAENITPYVHGSQALALHVQTNAGQVAASVWEGGSGGGTWLPQAAAPATSLVIPGLTVASSAARLFVVVPGAANAQVQVTAYTPAGAADQFPGAPVDASADAATPVTLSSLGASAAGLKLTSNTPIVAGVLVPGSGIGSFTTAVSPIAEQGVVAGNPETKGVTVGLLLTAPKSAVRVTISVVSAGGTLTTPSGDQSVAVAAAHTLAVTVPRPSAGNQPFAIVVTPQPGSGPLYAARVVTSGSGGLSAPLSALLPVASAMTSITLPPAQDSYTAVLP
ncbi:MAG TPA: DUF5719 family protein [Trebonia sp.]